LWRHGIAGSTVRLDQGTHAALRELARASNEPLQTVLAKAVEAYRRQRLLEQTNEAYATLRRDPSAWERVTEEREAWDATLQDSSPDA
jgi:hypothetical protein